MPALGAKLARKAKRLTAPSSARLVCGSAAAASAAAAAAADEEEEVGEDPDGNADGGVAPGRQTTIGELAADSLPMPGATSSAAAEQTAATGSSSLKVPNTREPSSNSSRTVHVCPSSALVHRASARMASSSSFPRPTAGRPKYRKSPIPARSSSAVDAPPAPNLLSPAADAAAAPAADPALESVERAGPSEASTTLHARSRPGGAAMPRSRAPRYPLRLTAAMRARAAASRSRTSAPPLAASEWSAPLTSRADAGGLIMPACTARRASEPRLERLRAGTYGRISASSDANASVTPAGAAPAGSSNVSGESVPTTTKPKAQSSSSTPRIGGPSAAWRAGLLRRTRRNLSSLRPQ
mmetsp:Transcript_22682/g.85942  ORF Transcript_22682/g.85942 Transcript_22682/m.85942 type:complete len:354 (+) Transcript_22682:146-1207(+)